MKFFLFLFGKVIQIFHCLRVFSFLKSHHCSCFLLSFWKQFCFLRFVSCFRHWICFKSFVPMIVLIRRHHLLLWHGTVKRFNISCFNLNFWFLFWRLIGWLWNRLCFKLLKLFFLNLLRSCSWHVIFNWKWVCILFVSSKLIYNILDIYFQFFLRNNFF